MSRGKYTVLSFNEKSEFIRYLNCNTTVSDNKVANMFYEKFKKTISKSG